MSKKTFKLDGAARDAALQIRQINDAMRERQEAAQRELQAQAERDRVILEGLWEQLGAALGVQANLLTIDSSYEDDHGLLFAVASEPSASCVKCLADLLAEQQEASAPDSDGQVH